MCVCEGFGALIKCVGADVGLKIGSFVLWSPLWELLQLSAFTHTHTHTHTHYAGCSCCFQCLLSMHSNAHLYERDKESNCLTGSVLYIDLVTGVVLDTGIKALQSQHFPVLLSVIHVYKFGNILRCSVVCHLLLFNTGPTASSHFEFLLTNYTF